MRLIRNKILGVVILSLFLTSCAATKSLVDTVASGSKLFTVSSPERLPTFQVGMAKPRVKRGPANIKRESLKSEKDLTILYFLSLYQQYQYFNLAVGGSEERLICPKFHNELLDYSHHDMSVKTIEKAPFMSQHPLYEKSNTHESFLTYNEVNKREIEELCHSGESDGLYRFINLAKFYRTPKSFPVKSNPLVAYFKIPVVANIYFLNNLRSTAQRLYISPVEKQVLEQLNASMVEDYLYGHFQHDYNNKQYTYYMERK